jgi:iron-sulfur cluster repair protein YtfE (RIC family)
VDALEVLKQAHREAESTFQQIQQASPDERAALWAKLKPQLKAHEQYEDQYVYGPISKEAQGRDADLASWDQRHDAEVSQVESLIGQAGQMDPRDPRWMQTINQVRMMLQQHIQEEEQQIFPRIRQFWSQDRLDDAGNKVRAAKTAAMGVGTVSGAVRGAVDTIKDAMPGGND